MASGTISLKEMLLRACLCLIILGFSVAHCRAQSVALLDELNGIPPYVLESQLKDLPGPVAYRAKVRGLPKYSVRADDAIMLDSIVLKAVDYFLFEEKLLALEFFTETKEESERALLYLQARFGPCEQIGRAPRYNWRGKYVTLSYDRNLLTGEARIRLESIPMQLAFEKFLAEQAGY